MVFSSIPFLYVFMPLFFGIYYLAPGRWRNGVLLTGSLCFYAVGTVKAPLQFLLFLVSMAVDYLAGALMQLQIGRAHV